MSYRAQTFEAALKEIIERAKRTREVANKAGILTTGVAMHAALGDIIDIAEKATKRD